MKPWIKTFARRGAVAVATMALLGAVAAAFAEGPGCGPHHPHRPMSEADAAQMSARMVERIGQRLDLDAPQKERLKTLADALQAQRKAMMGTQPPREQLQALVAGSRFDRAAAQAQAEARADNIRKGSPVVIAAAADFFDALRPEQQAKVREFLARGPLGRPGRGPAHGPHPGDAASAPKG